MSERVRVARAGASSGGAHACACMARGRWGGSRERATGGGERGGAGRAKDSKEGWCGDAANGKSRAGVVAAAAMSAAMDKSRSPSNAHPTLTQAALPTSGGPRASWHIPHHHHHTHTHMHLGRRVRPHGGAPRLLRLLLGGPCRCGLLAGLRVVVVAAVVVVVVSGGGFRGGDGGGHGGGG